jgi:nucleoside-triphosphatase THEP1
MTILVRGAPGCGKSQIASLIVAKEKSLGNNRVSHLSSSELQRDERDWFMMSRKEEMLVRKFRDQLREGKFCFFVVEVEGESLYAFERFYQLAMSFGHIHVSLVECLQPEEVIKKYARNEREMSEVMRANKEILKEPLPKNVLLLDAEKIYERDRMKERVYAIMQRNFLMNDYSTSAHKFQEPKIELAPNPFPDFKFPDDDGDFKEQVKELLKNPNFQKLIQSSFLNLSIDPKTFKPEVPVAPQMQTFIRRVQPFRVRRTIEYNHKPKPDPYELVLGFRPSKIFDYGHRSTDKLFEIRCNTDIDEVIALKKAEKIEAKKNYYTELVDKSEEMESNPSYPNNWQVVGPQRPNLLKKRKNKLMQL